MNDDGNETMDGHSDDGGICIFFKRTDQATHGAIHVTFLI
jgi:hypothetical protein